MSWQSSCQLELQVSQSLTAARICFQAHKVIGRPLFLTFHWLEASVLHSMAFCIGWVPLQRGSWIPPEQVIQERATKTEAVGFSNLPSEVTYCHILVCLHTDQPGTMWMELYMRMWIPGSRESHPGGWLPQLGWLELRDVCKKVKENMWKVKLEQESRWT